MFPIPLITAPLIIYSLISPFGVDFAAPLIAILSLEDMLIVSALILVAIETWRSTAATPQTARHLVVDLIVLLLVVIEWMAPWNRTGTFVVLTIMAFVNLVVPAYVAFVVKGQNNVWVSGR